MPAALFSCPSLELININDVKPNLVTPLGTLIFDAEFDGVVIGELKPSAVYCLERGGFLFNWTLDDLTAELLLCRQQLELPEKMAVDDCWVGLWRLRTIASRERTEFSCRWESGYQWTEGGADSGEGKDAQTWDENGVRVTLGTIDADWLAGQAACGLLPRRWADILGMNLSGITPDADTGKIDPIVYLKDGFQIVLPALESGEKCQVQFAVAWSTLVKSEPENETVQDDISTWFAVECRPEDILLNIGCW